MEPPQGSEAAPDTNIDLRRHEAEDGTVYWSMIVGGEAIHIIKRKRSFLAVDMLGQRIGSMRTLAAISARVLASTLRADRQSAPYISQ